MTATTGTTDQFGDVTAAAGPAVTTTRGETLGCPGPNDAGTGPLAAGAVGSTHPGPGQSR